jgi:hypothetical protein
VTHPAIDQIVSWWTDRLAIADKRPAFASALRDHFSAEWAKEVARDVEPSVCLRVDYDPFDVLLDAVNEAGIECRGFMFSARGILPEKTCMQVSADKVEASEGRRAAWVVIWEAA